MGWINERLKAGHDEAAALVTHVQWSENGSSESANLARTAVTLKAATTAHPSVVANDGEVESANSTSATDITITHFAYAADGTVQTEWIPLGTARTLKLGDNVKAADGSLAVNLYRAATAP
jgi:hypothetical protein